MLSPYVVCAVHASIFAGWESGGFRRGGFMGFLESILSAGVRWGWTC